MDRMLQLVTGLNFFGLSLLPCAEHPASLALLGLHPSRHTSQMMDIALVVYELILLFLMAILSWKRAMRQVRRDREARYERISLRHP
jgi:hypothetical protein